MISGNRYEQAWGDIGQERILESSNVIDNLLKFDRYDSNLCSKAINEPSVLTRIMKNIDSQNRRVLVKAFLELVMAFLES